MLAEIVKNPAKLDCLKDLNVLQLEELVFTPFHLLAAIFFLLAIIHTLSANKIHQLARWIEIRRRPKKVGKHISRHLAVQALYFLSEVELIFGIWVIPLFISIGFYYDWNTALGYINTRDYTEPLFVVVIMSLSATRPIVHLAEKALKGIAHSLGGSLSAWWLTLLTLGPIMGSFITEVGAMALSALLLSRRFYDARPSQKLAYATIGLLFVNISIGGVLTTFASPAVLILAHAWNWTTLSMFATFGWKAILGILISNGAYWFYFRKEFAHLEKRRSFSLSKTSTRAPTKDEIDTAEPVPKWITLINIVFIVFTVMSSHYPAIFIAIYLFFLGFHRATRCHQYALKLSRPILVGFFLAALVIHGGLQGWWVVDILEDLSANGVMGISILLTAFNDNTAISYLSTLVPNWGEVFKYAIFTGVVAGGGLTVIANAPNPAGFQILRKHFSSGISPFKLFRAALFPTLILYIVFYLFGPLGFF